MKSWLTAVAAFVSCTGVAHADPVDGWSFTAIAENDGFNYAGDHTDRYYTAGIEIAGTSPAIACGSIPGLARLGIGLEDAGSACTTDPRAIQSDPTAQGDAAPVLYRWGFKGGQKIYTPVSHRRNPDPNDHPYAGWTYGGISLGSYSAKETNTLELQVGMVGPSSGSHWMQDRVHHMMGRGRFNGWRHQLKNEPAFVVLGERRWAPNRLWPATTPDNAAFAIDSSDHVSFAVGTVEDSLTVGRAYRAGFGLDADSGLPRARMAPSRADFNLTEGWSAYVFAGVDGRAVARNIFLDGNTFRGSARVDKRALVAEATSGAAVRWRALRLGYTWVWQSEEFEGQRGPQKFGSWSVSLAPLRF